MTNIGQELVSERPEPIRYKQDFLKQQTKRIYNQTNLEIGEEVFVSALQDVELRVVEVGILVDGAVSGPDKAAHFGSAFGRELAVEDDDHSLVRAGRDSGGPQEKVLHLVFLVQV